MKKRYGIAGLLLMMLVLMTSISFVAAYDYEPELMHRAHGKTWWFSTNDPTTGDTMFSGKYVDKTEIVAKYWIDSVYTTIVPKNIVLSEHKVTLFFYAEDIPDEVDGAVVTGELKNGMTFEASGPGWMWWKG